MTTAYVPTKALFGAMLLGVATFGVAKLISRTPRAGADEDTRTDAEAHPDADNRGSEAGASARPPRGGARAPYASGLSSKSQPIGAHIPGTAVPVAEAKHGDALGEAFSSGVITDVSEVAPSAENKGGLADGGR